MAKEIECKLMGMDVKEFIHLASLKNIHFSPDLEMIVTDVYWGLPSGKLIRRRRMRVENNPDDIMYEERCKDFYDLTIKGSEETTFDEVSTREETILELRQSIVPEDINNFLILVGAEKKYTVKKQRTFLFNKDDESHLTLMIHHDKLVDGSVDAQGWIEIESEEGDSRAIFSLLNSLGIEEGDSRLSNKSTLDIMEEKKV